MGSPVAKKMILEGASRDEIRIAIERVLMDESERFDLQDVAEVHDAAVEVTDRLLKKYRVTWYLARLKKWYNRSEELHETDL